MNVGLNLVKPSSWDRRGSIFITISIYLLVSLSSCVLCVSKSLWTSFRILGCLSFSAPKIILISLFKETVVLSLIVALVNCFIGFFLIWRVCIVVLFKFLECLTHLCVFRAINVYVLAVPYNFRHIVLSLFSSECLLIFFCFFTIIFVFNFQTWVYFLTPPPCY